MEWAPPQWPRIQIQRMVRRLLRRRKHLKMRR
jgi:hypothetical protein